MPEHEPASPQELARGDLVRNVTGGEASLAAFDLLSDDRPFAVIKASGEVDTEELVGVIDQINRLGFPVILIDDTVIAAELGSDVSANEQSTQAIIDGLNRRSPSSAVTTTSLLEVDPAGEPNESHKWTVSPTISETAQAEVMEHLVYGRTVVVPSLGKVTVSNAVQTTENLVRLDGDASMLAITESFRPHKAAIVSPEGGMRDNSGDVISVLNPKSAKELIENGVITGTTAHDLAVAMRLVEASSNRLPVTLGRANGLVIELFSSYGDRNNTLLTPRGVYERHADTDSFDIAAANRLIEESFGARLSNGYFDLPDIDEIILSKTRESSYAAIGVVRRLENGVRYLCKVAVSASERGHGRSSEVVDLAIKGDDDNEEDKTSEPIVWRARIALNDGDNNWVRQQYQRKADGYVQPYDNNGNLWEVYYAGFGADSAGLLAGSLKEAANMEKTIFREGEN